jgi:uncharacterized protein (UPF0332 family)
VTSENARENARAEVVKALAALRAARSLGDLQLFDDAASRLYYAVFHLLAGALVALGVQAQTHSGLAALLGQHLVKPGLLPAHVARDFATLMALRNQADYNRHFVMDGEGFASELGRAERVFSLVEDFLAAHGVEVLEDSRQLG